MLIKIVDKKILEKPQNEGGSYFDTYISIKGKSSFYEMKSSYYVTNENWSKIQILKREISFLEGYIDFGNDSHKKELKRILSKDEYNHIMVYSRNRFENINNELEKRKNALKYTIQLMAKKEFNTFTITRISCSFLDKINKVEYYNSKEKISYVKDIKRIKEKSDSFRVEVEDSIFETTIKTALNIIRERTNERSFISF